MNSEKILFTNHFRERVMELHLPNGLVLEREADINHLKQVWGQNVLEWHTPYKCVVDFSCLDLNQELSLQFVRAVKHMRAFFMTDLIVACGTSEQLNMLNATGIPAKFTLSVKDAQLEAGLKTQPPAATTNTSLFAGRIEFKNHFETGIMELSFSSTVRMETDEDIDELLEALEGNILRWHRAYALIIDTDLLADTPTAHAALTRATCIARGFFCQEVQGFGNEKRNFPFPIQRTRHRALEICSSALASKESEIKTVLNCNRESSN